MTTIKADYATQLEFICKAKGYECEIAPDRKSAYVAGADIGRSTGDVATLLEIVSNGLPWRKPKINPDFIAGMVNRRKSAANGTPKSPLIADSIDKLGEAADDWADAMAPEQNPLSTGLRKAMRKLINRIDALNRCDAHVELTDRTRGLAIELFKKLKRLVFGSKFLVGGEAFDLTNAQRKHLIALAQKMEKNETILLGTAAVDRVVALTEEVERKEAFIQDLLKANKGLAERTGDVITIHTPADGWGRREASKTTWRQVGNGPVDIATALAHLLRKTTREKPNSTAVRESSGCELITYVPRFFNIFGQGINVLGAKDAQFILYEDA